MRLVFFLLLVATSFGARAQCKTYFIGINRDTLNCVDANGRKQGKWVIEHPQIRITPASTEEGEFVNDEREGLWRRFNKMGDLLAEENYVKGLKDGICRYYTIAGLEREESWLAVIPRDEYDTVAVVDLRDGNSYEKVRVKREGESFEHGVWKYYQPGSNSVLTIHKYVMGKRVAQNMDDFTAGTGVQRDSADVKKIGKPDKEKMKPKEVLEFEKKYPGKKKYKMRDGRTG